MCQIFFVAEDGKYPSQAQVDLEEEKNQDGCGLMWYEKVKGSLQVAWEKGLTAKEAFKIFKTIPRPAAFHMRNSTSGGDDKRLTHPFPVSLNRDVQLALKGHHDNMMMHNGTWLAWQDVFKYKAFASNEKIPKGPWSDSRALAYLGAANGIGLLDVMTFSDGRILWFEVVEGKHYEWKWGVWLKGDGYIYSAPLQYKTVVGSTGKGSHQIGFNNPHLWQGHDYHETSEKSVTAMVKTTGGLFWTTEELTEVKMQVQQMAHMLGVKSAELVDPVSGYAS